MSLAYFKDKVDLSNMPSKQNDIKWGNLIPFHHLTTSIHRTNKKSKRAKFSFFKMDIILVSSLLVVAITSVIVWMSLRKPANLPPGKVEQCHSVTRWLDYLFNICPFTTFVQKHNKFAKVVWTFRQILSKSSRSDQTLLNCARVADFAQSCHTEQGCLGNLGTDLEHNFTLSLS